MQTIRTESGFMKVLPENVTAVMLALSNIKPPKQTLSRKGPGVKIPNWSHRMSTREYCRKFDELNHLVKGGRSTDEHVHPAPDYNANVPLFEIIPDDPDYIEPEKVAKPKPPKRKTRNNQADAYRLGLQRILDVNPLITAMTDDLWLAIGEMRRIARHTLGAGDND